MIKSTKDTYRAVLFDWAGTTVDYGSRAPTEVFREIFRREGVEITEKEARGPMGRAKHEHIELIANMPRVSELWQQAKGAAPRRADVDRMYEQFLPLQKEVLARGSDVIPGVVEAVEKLRASDMLIGSTTGYTRELMEVVAPLAKQQGYVPDAVICSDDVAVGRPAPWMNFHAAEQLGVYPMTQIVAVDDTPAGLAAARNASMLSVGVAMTGNALGLTQDEAEALPEEELQARLAEITEEFLGAGAHHVIRSVAELPELLDRLAG